ncbi:exonuclease domain-containing protein [Marinoscillum furvescens]|uniref:DNA polymerase-3 subunit epsilon n=1 Tax=Marinoscillum furvescens DSM 4134 TaxID=1122208 RepID=A0A3D9KYM6_MARFU|nr:exonuclease domain-containing protein [Marinoscillum furvescens]RED94910.1 DNA polymerase-3 subunit epsilon [Marinoscillum furvescens DSM 4134]
MKKTGKTYAIIDVETTGGMAGASRITEVSAFLFDGERVVDEFTSLVNPQMPIPGFITQLTGIDDDMVRSAPTFEEIARPLLEVIGNSTFVAHNVNFDFGMIRGEYRRVGYAFDAPKLCSVKLARKYLPGFKSYSLGRICEQLNIPINGRHRARGDAEATVELFRLIMDASGGHPTVGNDSWVSKMPEGFDRRLVDDLPESSGILYFKNQNGDVIYVEGARDLYKAAIKQLNANSQKAHDLRNALASIDFEEVNSELIVSLKAANEHRKHLPDFNKNLKTSAYQLVAETDMFGYTQLQVVSQRSYHGVWNEFQTKKLAENHLAMLRDKYHLCAQLTGQADRSKCQKAGKFTCPGPCHQLESADSYQLRVVSALRHELPEKGTFALLEPAAEQERAFILFENYEYVGYGQFNEEYDSLSSFDDFKAYVTTDFLAPEKVVTIRKFLGGKQPMKKLIFDEQGICLKMV